MQVSAAGCRLTSLRSIEEARVILSEADQLETGRDEVEEEEEEEEEGIISL